MELHRGGLPLQFETQLHRLSGCSHSTEQVALSRTAIAGFIVKDQQSGCLLEFCSLFQSELVLSVPRERIAEEATTSNVNRTPAMRCNACWRELEGRAIATTCGHLLCPDDANKILGNDGACPICDQVLSKSHMKPVDINPGEEWTNMAMAGISPQILMKTAYRSIMFFMGQRELEMQFKMNKIVSQCRQKCEVMQEKFTEKLEQVHTAYQKMAKRCKLMEQEIESLTKDKQELQEKYAEKSRQKRKLDEMYDQLRNEFEGIKRSAIQPAGNFFQRAEPDLFATPDHVGARDPFRQDGSIFTPDTPGQREDIWPKKKTNSGPFDVSGGSPIKAAPGAHVDAPSKRNSRPVFGGAGPTNPSAALRSLIMSPLKRPQLSRMNPQMFTL